MQLEPYHDELENHNALSIAYPIALRSMECHLGAVVLQTQA